MKQNKLLNEKNIRSLVRNLLFEGQLSEAMRPDDEGLAGSKFFNRSIESPKNIGPQSFQTVAGKDGPGPDGTSIVDDVENEVPLSAQEVIATPGIVTVPPDSPASSKELGNYLASVGYKIPHEKIDDVYQSFKKMVKNIIKKEVEWILNLRKKLLSFF